MTRSAAARGDVADFDSARNGCKLLDIYLYLRVVKCVPRERSELLSAP